MLGGSLPRQNLNDLNGSLVNLIGADGFVWVPRQVSQTKRKGESSVTTVSQHATSPT